MNVAASRALDNYSNKYFGDFLKNDNITEICYNGDNCIWTLNHIAQWEKNPTELTYQGAYSFASALASFTNTEIQKNKPILSATLPAGERVQVVIPPAMKDKKISITIRKPSKTRFTLKDFSEQGLFQNIVKEKNLQSANDKKLLTLYNEKKFEDFLKKAVVMGKNIIISGETGSGKTTFMKSLIDFIPTNERLITIEDVPEIILYEHENYVNLFYPSEAKEEDPVTSSVLLKSCLRMKPDRILLAELRGGETYDFINVISSGHNGSITSCHAGSVEETFTKLVLLTLKNSSGQKIPHDTIYKILYDMIDVVVHMHAHNGRRYITEIYYKGAK